VGVIEKGLVAGQSEAVVLLIDGTFEAVLVGFEVEGASEKIWVIEHRLGIGRRNLAHGSDVFFDAGLLEARGCEVLRGADEDAGAAADGLAECGEVTSGFGGEEEDRLLGFIGDGDGYALLDGAAIPGFYAGKPVVRRRVRRAAKEGEDKEEMDGLAGGKFGMQPELIAWLEVWDFGDGKGPVASGDADIDLWTFEVETRLSKSRAAGESAGQDRADAINPNTETRPRHYYLF
jgi:hypothetical protein